MFYYQINYEAPFCGTDHTEYLESDHELTRAEEDEIWEDKTQDLFDSFGYMVNGWGEDGPTEEQEEEFKEDCTVEIIPITKEQYEENCEEC